MKYLLFFVFCFFSVLRSDDEIHFELVQLQKDKSIGWDSYLKATELYSKGFENEALVIWKDLAEKKNSRALARVFQLSQKHNRDLSSSLDPKLAIHQYFLKRESDKALLRKDWQSVLDNLLVLSNTDDAWALSILGRLIIDYPRNKEDFDKGVLYTQKSADLGYSPAADYLGQLYLKGHHYLVADAEKGLNYLVLAEKLGDPYASLHLGQYYHNSGDPKIHDLKKAFGHYEKAANLGIQDAILNLGILFEEGGQGFEKDLKKAESFYQKLLDSNDIEIYRFLALRYFYGRDGIKDKQKGLTWYRLSAEKGGVEEKYKYADLYYSDNDVRDYKMANQLFTKLSLDPKLRDHQYRVLVNLKLGEMYFKGLGVKQDYLLAKSFYEQVDHTSEALERIIEMYTKGLGLSVDEDKAIFYLKKLLDPSRPDGYEKGHYYTMLADIYYKKNLLQEAITHYRLGAIHGSKECLEKLTNIYKEAGSDELVDLAEIHLILGDFKNALRLFDQVKEFHARAVYMKNHLYHIPKFEGFSPEKFKKGLEDLLANLEKQKSTLDTVDRSITDGYIEPMLSGLPYEARIYYWLAEIYREESSAKKDLELVRKSANYSIKAAEKGYRFGYMDAGVSLIRNGGEELEKEGLARLTEAANKNSEHAAALLFNYYSLRYRTSADEKEQETFLSLSRKHLEQAKALDKGETWREQTVTSLMQSGVAKVLKPSPVSKD